MRDLSLCLISISCISISCMSLNSLRLPRHFIVLLTSSMAPGAMSTTYWRQHHIRQNLVRVSFSIAIAVYQRTAKAVVDYTLGFSFHQVERDDLSTKRASCSGADTISLATLYIRYQGRTHVSARWSKSPILGAASTI